jgi:multicomponent Na+:H+ antiporter subunit F
MRDVYAGVCVAALLIAALLLVRVARGPSVSDRIVAVNALATNSAVAVLYFAAFADRVIYLDPALWLSSFSYLGALVWARYLERGLL